MNTPNDGGPAFPMPSGPEPRVDLSTHFNEGMSLRDYFAAAAMQGMAANHNLYLTFVKHRVPEAERMVSTERWVEIQQEFSRDLVASAFRTADAMLAAKGGAS